MGRFLPFLPRKPCKTIGCANLTRASICAECQRKGLGIETRPTATERGYGKAWKIATVGFLRDNPFCADPFQKHGLERVPATEVDHKVPHLGNPEKFWDWNNLQSLCKSCHSFKTVKFDGGFGRARVQAESNSDLKTRA